MVKSMKEILVCSRFVNKKLCGKKVDFLFQEKTAGFGKIIMIGLCTEHSAENGVSRVKK